MLPGFTEFFCFFFGPSNRRSVKGGRHWTNKKMTQPTETENDKKKLIFPSPPPHHLPVPNERERERKRHQSKKKIKKNKKKFFLRRWWRFFCLMARFGRCNRPEQADRAVMDPHLYLPVTEKKRKNQEGQLYGWRRRRRSQKTGTLMCWFLITGGGPYFLLSWPFLCVCVCVCVCVCALPALVFWYD